MQKTAGWILAVALTALCSGSALAGEESDEEWHARHERKQKVFQEAIRGLGLSAEQQAKIEAQREKTRGDKTGLRGVLKEKKAALRDALEMPEIDRAQIDQLVLEIADLKARMLRLRVDSLLEVRAALTPEQFRQFQEKMKEADRES